MEDSWQNRRIQKALKDIPDDHRYSAPSVIFTPPTLYIIFTPPPAQFSGRSVRDDSAEQEPLPEARLPVHQDAGGPLLAGNVTPQTRLLFFTTLSCVTPPSPPVPRRPGPAGGCGRPQEEVDLGRGMAP